jgi:hypothetical protein
MVRSSPVPLREELLNTWRRHNYAGRRVGTLEPCSARHFRSATAPGPSLLQRTTCDTRRESRPETSAPPPLRKHRTLVCLQVPGRAASMTFARIRVAGKQLHPQSSSRRGCAPRCRFGRVAAAPELAATRRSLREAKRQALIEDCDVGPRDCVPKHGRGVRACSRSTTQQTATTAVGLELGSHDALDGTIGCDGTRSRGGGHCDDSFSCRAGRQRAIAMATKRDLATTRC